MSDLIGIDIGQFAVKIARAKKSGKSFSCNFMSYDVIPPEVRGKKEAMAAFMSTLLQQYKIVKGQPVIHVGFGDVIMREIHVDPSLRGDELEGAIEVDLAPALPFGIEQVYFDYDEDSRDGNYLTVAARRDKVDFRVDMLADRAKTLAGPEVDVDVFALERVMEGLYRTRKIESGAVALLDIGYMQSRFHVFHDGDYIFTRESSAGGNAVNDMIGDIYDVDPETAEMRKMRGDFAHDYDELVLTPYAHSVAEQINFAMDFYDTSAESSPIQVLYLTGGGSQLQGLIDKLRMLLDIPVQMLSLEDQIKSQARKHEQMRQGSHHVLAIGLGLEA